MNFEKSTTNEGEILRLEKEREASDKEAARTSRWARISKLFGRPIYNKDMGSGMDILHEEAANEDESRKSEKYYAEHASEIQARAKEIDKINAAAEDKRIKDNEQYSKELLGKNNPTERTKDRAMERVQRGELRQAIDVMVSDLSKNPTWEPNMPAIAGMAEVLRNMNGLTEKEVTDFIQGFEE